MDNLRAIHTPQVQEQDKNHNKQLNTDVRKFGALKK